MAGHKLIEAYLGQLRAKLPGDTVEELADGLLESWEHHQGRGMTPDRAADAAIAEFGTPQEINNAFVAHAGGRRIARILLATGPAVGLCWGASLVTARVWAWPVPTAAIIAYGIVLLCTVGLLAAAATSQHSYPRTRLGNVGAGSLLLLDAVMLVAVLVSAPHPVWPMAVAMPASVIRIGLTVASLPRWRLRAGA